MKITKRQLKRIIKEEKARIIAEQRDDRAFLQAMETIMDQLMVMDPAARVQNAETLIQNLETVIDQALSGLPDSQGRRM
jgi:phospholipid N-methyltransferase